MRTIGGCIALFLC